MKIKVICDNCNTSKVINITEVEKLKQRILLLEKENYNLKLETKNKYKDCDLPDGFADIFNFKK